MKLEISCKACQEKIRIKSNAISRPELAGIMGDRFSYRCDSCAIQKKYHVNEVVAAESNLVKVVGIVFGLSVIVVTTLFFWNKGYITNLGLILGGGIIFGSTVSSSSSTSHAFNKYRITSYDED